MWLVGYWLLTTSAVPIVVASDAAVGNATSTALHKKHKPLTQLAHLIRHGEKDDGDDLSPRGQQRARCLADRLLDAGITHLFAYDDKPSRRPVETITPLAKALGLDIDVSYKRDEVKELVAAIGALDADAVVLVCWEHTVLTSIAHHLGVDSPPDYPSDEYDWEWTILEGALKQSSEDC